MHILLVKKYFLLAYRLLLLPIIHLDHDRFLIFYSIIIQN